MYCCVCVEQPPGGPGLRSRGFLKCHECVLYNFHFFPCSLSLTCLSLFLPVNLISANLSLPSELLLLNYCGVRNPHSYLGQDGLLSNSQSALQRPTCSGCRDLRWLSLQGVFQPTAISDAVKGSRTVPDA